MHLQISIKRVPPYFTFSTICAFCFISVLTTFSQRVQAAPVTGLYGSFGGYWSSSSTAISTTLPNDSNLLLGFTVGGITYSTGVNDAELTANNVTFTPQIYRAMPVPNVTATNSSTYIGIVSRWGGVYQQSAYPNGEVPDNTSRPISYYMDNGTQGLELGTAVFNAPSSNKVRVNINGMGIDPSHIGDGIPDVLVTQMGDPISGETFGFYDAAGNPIGTGMPLSVNFVGIPSVGRQQWVFYNAADRSSVFFLNGARDVRLIAYDFADLGITATNYTQIVEFRQNLGGASDIAFIALNSSLPVEPPELTLNKTADPNPMTVGGTGVYMLELTNQATRSATSSAITVIDTLPVGLVPTSALGVGWDCNITEQTVRCTYVQSIEAGASAPSITISVTVNAAAAASVTNTATVSGGSDINCPAAARCTSSVTTNVSGAMLPVLALSMTASPMTVGDTGFYNLSLGNQGTQVATNGSVTVNDTLPDGVVPTSASGTGWDCNLTGQMVSCSYTQFIQARTIAPPLTISVAVGASAAVLTNSATASGGGDTTCPAAARCTSTVTTNVTGVLPSSFAVPTLRMPSILLTGVGIFLLGLWYRRRLVLNRL